MSRLLEEINLKAEEQGYDFTFLIPAGAEVRKFYEDRKYHDAFYKIKEYYVRGHKFTGNQAVTVKQIDEVDGIEDVLHFLSKRQEREMSADKAVEMLHTGKDWQIVLEESRISGEPTYIAVSGEGIKGVAFTRNIESGTRKNTIEIKKIYSEDSIVEAEFLKGIEERQPESNIVLVRDLADWDGSKQLWQPFYAQNNAPSAEYEDISEIAEPFDPSLNAYSYAMIRIFRIHDLMKKAQLPETDVLTGYSDEELIKILLRRPTMSSKEDSLESLLNLPLLTFEASLLLE